jgi:hypothetical protein
LTWHGFSQPGNGTGNDSGTQPQTEMGMRHDASVALLNIEMPWWFAGGKKDFCDHGFHG